MQARINYFYDWETIGRGWHLWDQPCDLEPAFYAFDPPMYSLDIPDDGRQHTLISGLLSRLSNEDTPAPSPVQEYPAPKLFPSHLIEEWSAVTIRLPKPTAPHSERTMQFLRTMSIGHPVSCEIVAKEGTISLSFVVPKEQGGFVEHQARMHFPEAFVYQKHDVSLLEDLDPDAWVAAIDVGLRHEFMCPLRREERSSLDRLQSVVGSLKALTKEEWGVVQILFQPVQNTWAQEIRSSVSDGQGGCFFEDAPYMQTLAEEKADHPLFAVAIRTLIQSNNRARANALGSSVTHSIIANTASRHNSLLRLSNKGYTATDHVIDVELRVSRRPGMILNLAELAVLAHPTYIEGNETQEAEILTEVPAQCIGHPFILGSSGEVEVSLSAKQRVRHIHCLGASGSGKSTLLHRMMVTDAKSGAGFMVVDPHGDLVEDVMQYLPPERYKDVVVIDPSDTQHPIGLNILEASTEAEKTVLSSDLIALFKRLSSSWGVQIIAVFANAIGAFLESTKGGTLLDLKRFLVEEDFRHAFLRTVTDHGTKYYWLKEFPTLKKNAFAPVLTRLDSFLRTKVIRNMVIQSEGLPFTDLVHQNKIILVKLSHGLIGKENSYLLGTMLISKLNQVMQGKQSQVKADRTPFYLYVDEFQNFITQSLEDILSGARKYGLGLVLANQYMHQVDSQSKEVAQAIVGNVGTSIYFRLGDTDAQKLSKGFTHFESNHFSELPIGRAIMKVETASNDFPLTTVLPEEIDSEEGKRRIQQITALSRTQFAGDRGKIEQQYAAMYALDTEERPTLPPVPTNVPTSPPKEAVVDVIDEEPMPVEPVELDNETIKEELAERENKRLHVQLQRKIKKLGQEHGFLATIEAQMPSGSGRVDVELRRDDMHIACEVSVTTSVAHELEKLTRCLDDAYTHILLVVEEEQKMNVLRTKTESDFSGASLERLYIVEPKGVTGFFGMLDEKKVHKVRENHVRGYRVTKSYAELSERELKTKQDAVARILHKK